MSDRGSTVLKRFDPKDYNVVMASGEEPLSGADYGEEFPAEAFIDEEP